VKDKAGNEYACPIEALEKADELSEALKNAIMDGATRGTVGD
jgi:hypothetical protein